MKHLLAPLLIAFSGCSSIHITHEEGDLPKIKVVTSVKECKMRFKHDEVKFFCNWEF